ncbi:MAG: alpha-amylase [Oscillochloris sp.]|nr:alpha-amylase [Oscillochloris sp.]
MWFESYETGREVLLHTEDVELGWSREDGVLVLLRHPGGLNVLGYGPPTLSLDLALGTTDGWLSTRAFARFLWHRIDAESDRVSVMIAVGLGPLTILDRYTIREDLISRQVTIENAGLDDLRLCGLRLMLPNACVGPAATCRFEAPGNSVRPRVGLGVAAAQRRTVLPRRFFAPGLRGGSAMEPTPSQGPGLLALHNGDPALCLLCWYETEAEAALPFLQGRDGISTSVSLGHEVGLCGWLRPGEQVISGTQQVVLLPSAWTAITAEIDRRTIATLPEPARWLHDTAIYVADARRHGGLVGLAAQLPALADLGVRCLALLPICITGGNPHSVQDFERIDPALGDLAAARALVRQAHDLGMHVLLDLPLQGACVESRYLAEHADWFVRDESGAFVIGTPNGVPVVGLHPNVIPPPGRYQFDWQHPDLQQYVIDWALATAVDLELDGYRAVEPFNPAPSWNRRSTHASAGSLAPLRVLARLRPALRRVRTDAALLSTLPGPAFAPICDGLFDYPVHHMFVHAALSRLTPQELGYYLDDHHRVVRGAPARIGFMEMHDTCMINPLADGLRGSRISRMLLAGMVLCGFVPALWSGQEQSDEAALRAVLRLWHEEPALRMGSAAFGLLDRDGPAVFSVIREYAGRRLVGLINFGAHPCRVRLDSGAPALPVGRDLLGHAPIDFKQNAAGAYALLAPFSCYCLEF